MCNVIKSDLNTYRSRKRDSQKLSNEERELRDNGIVIIKDFMATEDCDINRNEIENFVNQFNTTTTLENGTFVAFRTEVSNDDADHGMIDVSNIDKSIDTLRFGHLIPKIEKIISSATYSEVKFFRLNAYINKGVVGTRGYHVDNFSPNYKAFIYLTDVIDNSYGPYSYIKSSNGLYLGKYLNIYRNSILSATHRIPDMPKFYNKNEVINCLGKKGTLVISDQSGIHRGMPQEPGKTRIALVLNFK